MVVSAADIEARFGIPRRTVYYMAKTGRLPGKDVAGEFAAQARWEFSLKEVTARLEELRGKRQKRRRRAPTA